MSGLRMLQQGTRMEKFEWSCGRVDIYIALGILLQTDFIISRDSFKMHYWKFEGCILWIYLRARFCYRYDNFGCGLALSFFVYCSVIQRELSI